MLLAEKGTQERVCSYVCVHGHFYQPSRQEPFTGIIPREPGAAPYANFNEKITAECYRPNAETGNFAEISFDLGPTLAAWLEQAHPDVYRKIIEADHVHRQRYGVGNAMAQAYNHTILPLATARDKRTQILWGLQDFSQRYGHDAHGMWLAETAVDLECLDILAQMGVTYTVLAPWQAAALIDRTEPYVVRLQGGRTITVFFYHGPTSGGVSFDDHLTSDANAFAATELRRHRSQQKSEQGKSHLLLICTDGELYGHHKPFRDQFLSHLLHYSAPSYGFETCTLERYLRMHPPTQEVQLRVPSAWSCHHGVARWSTGCACTESESDWKPALRQALDHLSEQVNTLFERYTEMVFSDPWAARDAYLPLRNGWMTPEHFWERYGKGITGPGQMALTMRARLFLEAQYFMQLSFTSCGFFFEDLDRIEPHNSIAYARRAISLIWQASGCDLQREFVADLCAARSWRTHWTGADLYRRLPGVPHLLLPNFQQG